MLQKQQLVPSASSSRNAPAGNGRKADGDLFKNLVEIVPLVESLMDRRANPSFRRRASVAYTPAPPSTHSKVSDTKGKSTTQTLSAIKERDNGGDTVNKHIDNCASTLGNLSTFSSRVLTEEEVQNNKEELTMLREQLDDMRIKVSEKEEALKSTEESINQMTTHATLHELRRKIAEKEFLLTSANSQLSNAEVNLAEKQEVLDKLECEARISNDKVAKLQGDLDDMDFEKKAFLLFFQELSKTDPAEYSEDNITCFEQLDQLPHIDDLAEMEMGRMEEARLAYVAAVAFAKEKPSDESIAAAAAARLKLQAYAS